jgi:hypothetical protein
MAGRSSSAQPARPQYRLPFLNMHVLLSLKRRNGARLPTPAPDTNRRLVTFSLTRADGYRVARAQCCRGGLTVAVLWEPVLIRVNEESMLFQGFEQAEGQAVVQEWVVEPDISGARL